jgi:hypothetical protein
VGASYNLSTASSLAEPTCEPVPRRHSPRVSPMTKPPQSSSHTLIAPNLRRARDARSRALRGWSSPHDFSRLLVQNFPPSSSLSTGGGVCVYACLFTSEDGEFQRHIRVFTEKPYFCRTSLEKGCKHRPLWVEQFLPSSESNPDPTITLRNHCLTLHRYFHLYFTINKLSAPFSI